MRILQVVPTLGNGGAEHFVCELSNEFCRQNHQVDILTLYDVPSDNPLRKCLDSRISIYSLNKNKGLDISILFKIFHLVKIKKYDVVHGHVGAITYLLLASFVCRKVFFVATIHSDASFEAGSFLNKWVRKIMFRLNSCVPVTISKESERSFEALYGKKGFTIVNGVSEYVQKKIIQLKDRKDQVVFLHPASCQPVKNQTLLFSAFNMLLDHGYDAKIVWVGNNKTYYALYESLAPLMKRNVSFLGLVDNVRDYMVASDAICLSSKTEGMPMTIIEAFSVGCIPLCTSVGGIKNMINNNVNGFLSSDLSVEAYYEMMKKFCDLTEQERSLITNRARNSFDDYTISKCASNYLLLFQEKRDY